MFILLSFMMLTALCQFVISFQSVADIFHTLLIEIEKADGNVQEKSNCIVS